MGINSNQCYLCFADLRGAVIPGTDPPEHYSKLIGVEIPWVYDGTLFWECPFCQNRTHRFAEGTSLWRQAEPYVRRLDIIQVPRNPTNVTISSGQILYNVHPETECFGQACAIHHPSDHPLNTAEMEYRKRKLYRICDHGVAHPDVDDLSWRQRTRRRVQAVHECCRSFCCGASRSLIHIDAHQ